MSNRLLLSLALVFALATSAVVAVRVETVDLTPQEVCRNRVHHEMREVLDDYRAHVFGTTPALSGGEHVPRTGGDVDESVVGILETEGRLTSELIEPLVESYRVLRCRAESVCGFMTLSFQELGGDVTVHDFGCPEYTGSRYSECYFAGDTGTNLATADVPLILQQECADLVGATLQAEQAVLKLAVNYDSGYRSLLQFAGMTDWMMQGLPDRALETTRTTVNLFGKLYQIPCFIGQCDMPDTTSLSP